MQEPETKVKEKDRRADRSAYMDKETVIVLDFGGQYNQLIARRVRECHVYCEVHPCTAGLEQIKAMNPKGIIFTGGPNSVYGEDSPVIQRRSLTWGFRSLAFVMAPSLWHIC